MSKVISKSLYYLFVVFLMLPGIIIAQSNPHELYKDIIGSDYHFSYISSAAPPKILAYPQYGTFSVQNSAQSDVYNYSYAPGITEGNTSAVLEYYKRDAVTGELIPDYTTIYFRITKSLINCGDDRISTEKNSGQVYVDVLSNDTRTDGPLTLNELLYAENGAASIVGDQITFVPEPDFEGDAFIYYSVMDSKGKKGTGAVKVKVIDYATIPKKLNLDYISYGGNAVEIDLPFDGFKVNGSLSHGIFKSIEGKQLYIPNNNVASIEEFEISSNGITRFVTVRVIQKSKSNSWVKDDVRYTSKGGLVTLDVTKNDLKRNHPIVNYDTDLIPSSTAGVFSYQPPSYYSGTKRLPYTVSDGYGSETGFVIVHVNNFNQKNKYNYEFLTIENSPLVINYEIPISNFSFSVISDADHGSVSVNDGNSTITFECDEISGNNLIIYEPDYNYRGSDEFTVRYCVDGKCKNVSIQVEVTPEDGASCRCYTGCVWSGDANNDGVVNAEDLISMAYAFGETGDDSENVGTWSGRKTSDWNFIGKAGINAKYSDSDGNGIIDDLDFDAIEDNYNLNHALVPPQFIGRKPFPFTIEMENDTVYAGDLIGFDIGIGNQYFPALDVNGVSYSLGFPPTFVDSSSLKVDYHSNSWFGIDEKVVGLTHQIKKGWIESAVSRVGVASISGAGNVGRVSFIVEEDVVGGFRVKNNGIIPMTILISNIKVMTGDGEIAQLDDVETTIYINVNERAKEKENASLVIFPNPAVESLNLHMNGGHTIESYEIYNINGQKLKSSGEISSKGQKISLAGYDQGVYILRAETSSGLRIERFEILK